MKNTFNNADWAIYIGKVIDNAKWALETFLYTAFVMWWPSLPWRKWETITNDKNTNVCQKCTKAVFKFNFLWLILYATLIFWLIGKTTDLRSLLAQVISGFYAGSFLGYFPPAVFFVTILGTINYLFRRAQFKILHSWKVLLAIYGSLAVMMHSWGIASLLWLGFYSWLYLFFVTSETPAWQQWIVMICVACFCTVRALCFFPTWFLVVVCVGAWAMLVQRRKELIFFSPFFLAYLVPSLYPSFLPLFVSVLFLIYSAHEHYDHREGRDENRKDFSVIRERAFVRRKALSFFCLFAVTGLLTMEAKFCRFASSNIQSKAISNVYCKIDNVTDLSCLVDVQYFDLSDSLAASNQRCKDDEYSQWEFCGRSQLTSCWQLIHVSS